MAISDSEFTNWLASSDAYRCVIAEVNPVVSGSPTLIRLSTKNFIDSASGMIYEPVLNTGSFRIQESISLNGGSSISFGDISIDNTDGAFDNWLSHVWSGTSVTVKIGDVRWPESDFRDILIGSIEDIFSSRASTLNLKIRDKLQQLNVEITDVTLGGSTNNKNEILPLCFGEAFNVEPLLSNPATLEYTVHNGPIERIIEVRDNGVPVGITEDLANGKFTLLASPVGLITASVQGHKPAVWESTITGIVQRLVIDYGEASSKFTTGDIDAANFNAFAASNTQPIGAYVESRGNLLALCQELASSVGATLAMTRLGKLQIIQIDTLGSGAPYPIDESLIIENTLSIASKIPVKSSHKIAYARRYTVQDSLETGIPVEHKDIYATEWSTVTKQDAAVKALYKQTSNPVQKETNLLNLVTAENEATRLLNLFKVPRFVYRFKGTPELIDLRLGDAVNLTYPRFGLSGGKSGMVIGLSIDWGNFTVEVEVLA